MENIRKKQIKNLFNDFINTLSNGIWFSGIKKYGKYKIWFDNGQLWVNTYYKNNMEIKKYKKWYDNGQLEEIRNYNKKGELDGLYKHWNRKGNLIFEIKFKNNELVSINYINFNYNKYWFYYYDQMQRKQVYFYDKIKEMYNNEKYKKRTN